MTDKTAADYAEEIHAVITRSVAHRAEANASTNALVLDIVRNLRAAGFIIIPQSYIGFVDRTIERINEALQVTTHVKYSIVGEKISIPRPARTKE